MNRRKYGFHLVGAKSDRTGCRLIVPDIANQDHIIEALSHLFDDVAIVDRREQPSYGYQAVHLIVTVYGRMIEIQVRTLLQDRWAELSEKLSDVEDPAIKYGGGVKREFEAYLHEHLTL